MTTLIYFKDVDGGDDFEDCLQNICFIDYHPDDETYHAVIWMNVPYLDKSGDYKEGKFYVDWYDEPAYRKEVTFRATESADADFEIMYPVIEELSKYFNFSKKLKFLLSYF
jgi:hypothetical protein